MLSAGADTCAGVIITELTGCSCRTFRIYLAAVDRNVYGSFIVIAAVIAGSDTRAAARAAFCRDLTAVDNDGAGLFMLAAARLGLYPTRFAASRTRSRVSGRMFRSPFRARDTVEEDRPSSRARSLRVTLFMPFQESSKFKTILEILQKWERLHG